MTAIGPGDTVQAINDEEPRGNMQPVVANRYYLVNRLITLTDAATRCDACGDPGPTGFLLVGEDPADPAGPWTWARCPCNFRTIFGDGTETWSELHQERPSSGSDINTPAQRPRWVAG